ncbi:MAG: hypothetical protein HUJ28_05310 [Chromatiales bacterium]|nr:hypothetical protein [Chromatiales bacterium]
MNDTTNSGTAKVVYILYLASLIIPLLNIIGLIMAYVNRGQAPEWLQSHYTFQIRTFWIGLLYAVLGIITVIIFVGYLILLFLLVWHIVRCVKGLMYLDKNQAVPQPATWMFG